MKDKLRKIKYNIKHDFPLDKFLFTLALLFFAVCVWGTISSVTRNWELEQRLVARRYELTLEQLEIDSIELENKYLASEEYQELMARARQNKKLEGETLIYLPDNSDYAKHKHEEVKTEEIVEEPSNFEQWFTFLFGA